MVRGRASGFDPDDASKLIDNRDCDPVSRAPSGLRFLGGRGGKLFEHDLRQSVGEV